MKKAPPQSLKEELELVRAGKIKYEADPPFVIVRDPENLEKRLTELDRLNGIVRVSQKTYSGLSRKAKRSKMTIPEFLRKIANQQ